MTIYSNFLETRVLLVVNDLKDVNYRTCDINTFAEKAEEQGTVFTLQGFNDFLTTGQYSEFTRKLASTEYVFIRYVDAFGFRVEQDGQEFYVIEYVELDKSREE